MRLPLGSATAPGSPRTASMARSDIFPVSEVFHVQNVRCGLIQHTALGGNRPLPEIKKAMIDKHLKLIEQAAKKKSADTLSPGTFYGPYFCASRTSAGTTLPSAFPTGPPSNSCRMSRPSTAW